jgi:UDP-GlcNAc:undecaprenyl-phosphate GlcNAc-1-phosphate transferase
MDWNAEILFSSLALAVVLTPLVRGLGHRFGVLDHPHGDLKNHATPVPNVGGVAIVSAAVLPLLVFRGVDGHTPFAGVFAGAAVVFAMGLVDDRYPLSSKLKLPIQFVAACIAWYGGVRTTIDLLPEWANAALTVAWIVGITNAVNIIDIMDGLAPGVSAIAALAFYGLALIVGDGTTCALAAACLGATAGFLVYNRPPASIFMGDAGSGTVGFFLACVAVTLGYSSVNQVALVSPLLILIVPIYDTALVVLLRHRSGKPVTQGSRDHFALRIVAMGYTKKAAILMAYAASLATGAISLALVQVTLVHALAILAVVALLLVCAGMVLARAET